MNTHESVYLLACIMYVYMYVCMIRLTWPKLKPHSAVKPRPGTAESKPSSPTALAP